MRNIYKIWTDGAYSAARDQGGVGVVVTKEIDGQQIIVAEFSKMYKNTTNNQMELLAVIYALKCLKKADQIIIVSDSQYVIGCATKGWKRKLNKNLWKLYDETVKQIKCEVTFIWTKGHETDVFNQRADCLAQLASREISL